MVYNQCTLKSSTSKLFTSEHEKLFLKLVIEHKHSPRKHLTKVTISNNLKLKAVDDISERPLKLIREEVQSNISDTTLHDINFLLYKNNTENKIYFVTELCNRHKMFV